MGMAMPTLAELAASVTGLTSELKELREAKASAEKSLSLETEARKKLETDFATLKVKAEAPPSPKDKEDDKDAGEEPADIKECIANLEKAISEWKKSAQPGDESEAEDASDMEDDQEVSAARSKKLWPKAIAIRTKQLLRKKNSNENKSAAQKAFDEKVTKAVTAQIGALGIPVMSVRNPETDDLRQKKPDGDQRSRALIKRGFSEDPGVKALNATLGRK